MVSTIGSAPAIPADKGSQALEWRARLYARRPGSVRRHALRVLTRAAVLVTADLFALFAARWAMTRALTLLAPASAAQWRSIGPLASPGEPASLIFPLTLLAGLAIMGAYGRHRSMSAAVRLAAAVLLAVMVSTAALAALAGVWHALTLAASVGLVVWSALVAVRFLAERLLARVWPRDRWASGAVLIEDGGPTVAAAADALRAPGGEYAVAMTLTPAPLLAAQLRDALARNEVEAVAVCATLSAQQAHELLDVAVDAGCQFLYPPRALDLDGAHARLVWHSEHAFLELGPVVLTPGAVIVKRAFDILGAALLLTLAAPVMLLIAVAIRLDSRGPVFFVQDRAGISGRRFRMIKFRTMRQGADGEKHKLAHLNASGDVRLFKIPADPRITRLGRTLRRWSLDELPQLWNVLRGDMSLVGPRPFFESDFPAYEDHHFRRLDTKPGLTGLWQVSGRSDVVDFEEVIFLDRQYIERWSFWLDLSILLRTVPAVMRRTGAF